MSAALQRQVDQLLARVRDLETELQKLHASREQARRGFAEVALAAVETGETLPAALGAFTSSTQVIDDAQATILEIVNDAGTLKLKPIQNSVGANKAKVTYYNAASSQPSEWSSAGEPMLLARLRDGRWVRFPAGGGGNIEVDVVTGFETGTTGSTQWLKFRKKRIKVSSVTDLGLTDLMELYCS